MNNYIYILRRTDGVTKGGYVSAVVVAPSENEAKRTHPAGGPVREWGKSWVPNSDSVDARCIGTASQFVSPGVISSEYN